MSEEELKRLESVATELESAADMLQIEADDAKGRAEEAWDTYYSYDPGEDAAPEDDEESES